MAKCERISVLWPAKSGTFLPLDLKSRSPGANLAEQLHKIGDLGGMITHRARIGLVCHLRRLKKQGNKPAERSDQDNNPEEDQREPSIRRGGHRSSAKDTSGSNLALS